MRAPIVSEGRGGWAGRVLVVTPGVLTSEATPPPALASGVRCGQQAPAGVVSVFELAWAPGKAGPAGRGGPPGAPCPSKARPLHWLPGLDPGLGGAQMPLGSDHSGFFWSQLMRLVTVAALPATAQLALFL